MMNPLSSFYPYISLAFFITGQIFLYSTQLMHRVLRQAHFLWLLIVQTMLFGSFFLGNLLFLGIESNYSLEKLFFLSCTVIASLGVALTVSDFSFEPHKGLFVKKRWWFIGVSQEILFDRIMTSLKASGATILFEEKNDKIIAWLEQENAGGVIFELTFQQKLYWYVTVDCLCYPESKGFFKEKSELDQQISALFKTIL